MFPVRLDNQGMVFCVWFRAKRAGEWVCMHCPQPKWERLEFCLCISSMRMLVHSSYLATSFHKTRGSSGLWWFWFKKSKSYQRGILTDSVLTNLIFSETRLTNLISEYTVSMLHSFRIAEKSCNILALKTWRFLWWFRKPILQFILASLNSKPKQWHHQNTPPK